MTSTTPTYILNKSLTLVAWAMLLLCATACRGHRGYEPEPPEEPITEEALPIYLSLEVACADPSYPTTRAEDDEYYFEDAQSKYERIDHLRVIICNTSGVVVHNRLVAYYYNGSDDPEIKYDNLIFKVQAGDYTIHLFANEKSLPQTIRSLLEGAAENTLYPATQLENTELERSSSNQPLFSTEEYIPMIESFPVHLDMPLNKLDQYKSVNLFVTRVPIKFTFGIKEDIGEFGLAIQLEKIATKQYLLPHNVSYNPTKSDLMASYERTIVDYVVPANADREIFEYNFTSLTLRKSGQDEAEYYMTTPVYLCETEKGTTYRIRIRLSEPDGTFIQEWSDWKELPNLPSLPRNTHAIVRMSLKPTLNLEVDLMPYIGCYLDPFFGLPDTETPETPPTPPQE